MTQKPQAQTTQHTNRTSTMLVTDAARDLHAQEQPVTRESLAVATGLKMSIIDDRTRALVDDGVLHRMQRGVFVPVAVHLPPRPMSKTLMADGQVKIEIGDDVLTLTPREDRMLSQLMSGAAAQFAAIELGQQVAVVHAQLARRVLALERENNALRVLKPAGSAQLDLLAAPGAPEMATA